MATCSVCGGAMLTERPHRHPSDLRAAVEAGIAKWSRPDGEHVYSKGGIHAEVAKCGACGRLHTYRAVLALIPEGAVLVTEDTLFEAIRRAYVAGHPDLRSGLTTDPDEATLAAAIIARLRGEK